MEDKEIRETEKPETAKKKSSATSGKSAKAKTRKSTTGKSGSAASDKAVGSKASSAGSKKSSSSNSTKRPRKSAEKAPMEELYSQLPSAEEVSEIAPIDTDLQDADRIEAEAIAALPRESIETVPLESLLYDVDDSSVPQDNPEEAAVYEAYLINFKRELAAKLEAASKAMAQTDEQEPTDISPAPSEVISDSQTSGNELSLNEDTDRHQNELPYENDVSLTDESTDEPSEITPTDDETDEDPQLSIDFGDSTQGNITEDAKDSGYDPEKPRRIDSVFEFVELFVFTLLAVMLITTFFLRHSRVDGGSMDNTLHDGDHLLISGFMYEPQVGDIVVFEDYSVQREALIKRVIALEGDHVVVTEHGDVYVNDVLLEEDYVFIDGWNGRTDDCIVGAGEVYVLGDHRNVSKDSRSFGTIKKDSILGRVLLRFYPFEDFGTVE